MSKPTYEELKHKIQEMEQRLDQLDSTGENYLGLHSNGNPSSMQPMILSGFFPKTSGCCFPTG